MDSSFYPPQNDSPNEKAFQLEFKQLKEYFNFRRKFSLDKRDINKQNNYIQHEYYLINKTFINKWKEHIGYYKFCSLNINRDLNDDDYVTFKASHPENNTELIPLDNSNLYNEDGQIDPLSEFIIINRNCHKAFEESKKNKPGSKIKERSLPLKFLKDKIILRINDNIKIVYFKNDSNNSDEEFIVIFKEQKNKEKISADIEKSNFKEWLRNRYINMDGPDEYQFKEKGCTIKVVNKNLKLKLEKEKNIINQPILDNNQNNQFPHNQQNFQFNSNNNNNQFNNAINVINNDMNNLNLNNMNISPMMSFNNNNFNCFNNNMNMNNNIINPNMNNINNNKNNINQDPDQNPHTKDIIFPHKAGLVNVGHSGYLNATIECLSNIKKLTHGLLMAYGSYDVQTQPLCTSYSSLLYDLFHTKGKFINPKIFKEIIGKLNPLFEGDLGGDAKDLIIFMIEILNKELLSPFMNDNIRASNFQQKEMNSTNEQIMLNDFLNEFNLKKTLITYIFYGINRSVLKCFGCGICKYSFSTFNILIYPLKKVKEYKIRKTGPNNNLDLNLYDAFLWEQEEEKLEGENMIHCNRCKKLSPGCIAKNIHELPRILIILLNRGKNNLEFNEEFRFDEYLDFTHQNIIFNQSSYKKYFLCGIITHLGESGTNGHFIAYCRNDINDKFICYNDDLVTKVNVMDAMSTKISTNEKEKKTPYILIYHYMK